MSEALSLMLVIGSIAGAGALGYRMGFRRVARLGIPIVVAWGVAWSLASAGVSHGWFQPLGLLTPVALGLVGGAATWVAIRLVHRLLAKPVQEIRPYAARPRLDPILGATAGGAFGILLGASLGLLVMLGDGLMGTGAPAKRVVAAGALSSETSESDAAAWIRSLVRTANRGVVRHLPFVGSLSDEVEAVVIILNSDDQARETVARRRELDTLAELPTFRAIVEDRRIMQQLETFEPGDFATLYDLQKNPLILAFFAEERVQELITDLRLSVLAREIEEIAASGVVIKDHARD